MDTDWTFSSCSWMWEEDIAFKNSCNSSYWTKEEDKAFENALAIHYNDGDRWDKIAGAVPGKTMENVKFHYEALSDDVVAIESGKVPLPHYVTNNVHEKKRKSSKVGAQRGIPWTEEEHRRFLHGLQRFGRGDWKSISRYSVLTKSNSQVASHAQKYFKRLNSANREGKRPSINDITSTSAVTNNIMPIYPKKASTSPTHFHGTSPLQFSAPCSLFASHFASQPTFLPPVPCVQESRVTGRGLFDTPSTSEIMDLDVFVLPHNLDVD